MLHLSKSGLSNLCHFLSTLPLQALDDEGRVLQLHHAERRMVLMPETAATVRAKLDFHFHASTRVLTSV